MITWFFALTIAWLCRPGNRKRENETSKKIRRQLAKLEHIRRRDRKRQRQHSVIERGRERERESLQLERKEGIVLEELDDLQINKRQRKENKIAEPDVELTQSENSIQNGNHRENHKSDLDHEVHRSDDWLRQVRRSMKAELIGSEKRVQRTDSDSSSSRSTSSRSSKRESHRDLLLSSPRQRRQRSEHRHDMEHIEATTPPYARSQNEHLDRSHRSSSSFKDRRKRSTPSKASTLSAHSTHSRKEVLLTSPKKRGSLPQLQNKMEELIATTPKLIVDDRHNSSRSHRSHRSHRSRRDENDSSKSSTSSRSRRKSSKHSSRRDRLLTSPKERKDQLSVQRKSEKRKIARTSSQVAGHFRHSDHRKRSHRNRADSAPSSSRSSKSSRSMSRSSSKRESRRNLLLSSPRKRRQQIAAQHKSEKEGKAMTPPYAVDHHQHSQRRRHSNRSRSHKSHKSNQKTPMRRSTHRSKRGKVSKMHSSKNNVISDLSKDLKILRDKTANKSLMKNNKSRDNIQNATNKTAKRNVEQSGKIRSSKIAKSDMQLKKTKKTMNMTPSLASSKMASQRSLSESSKRSKSSRTSDESKKLLAVLDEIAPISRLSEDVSLKQKDSSQGLPPPTENSLEHSDKQRKLLNANAITDASESRRTCLMTSLKNPLNLDEQKNKSDVSNEDLKHTSHGESRKSLTIKDTNQNASNSFPKPTDHSMGHPQDDLPSGKARKPNSRSPLKEGQQVTKKHDANNSGQPLRDMNDSSKAAAHSITSINGVNKSSQSARHSKIDLLLRNKEKLVNGESSGNKRLLKKHSSRNDLSTKRTAQSSGRDAKKNTDHPKKHRSRKNTSNINKKQHTNRKSSKCSGDSTARQPPMNRCEKHMKQHNNNNSLKITERLKKWISQNFEKNREQSSDGKPSKRIVSTKHHAQIDLSGNHKSKNDARVSSKKIVSSKRHQQKNRSKKHRRQHCNNSSSKVAGYSKKDNLQVKLHNKHIAHRNSNASSRSTSSLKEYSSKEDAVNKHAKESDRGDSSRSAKHSQKQHSTESLSGRIARQHSNNNSSENAKYSKKHGSHKYPIGKFNQPRENSDSFKNLKNSEEDNSEKKVAVKDDKQIDSSNSSKKIIRSKRSNLQKYISGNEEMGKIGKENFIKEIKYPRKHHVSKNSSQRVKQKHSSKSKKSSKIGISPDRKQSHCSSTASVQTTSKCTHDDAFVAYR